MQEQHFHEMQSDLVDLLVRKIPQAPKEEVRQSVEEEFKKITDEEKILTLSEDETRLLMDFRKWSNSPGSASGVFHWRKGYGK